MEYELYNRIKKDSKMYDILKHNSYYIKYLNRDSNYYKRFVSDMKEKYKIRVTDKLNEAVDNIDLISTILDTLK